MSDLKQRLNAPRVVTTQPSPDYSKLEQWRQDLLHAAEFLEIYGWCQGRMGDLSGRVCAYGAIKEASGSDYFREPLYKFATHLGLLYRAGDIRSMAGEVARWNDVPTRTKQEVLNALREAARS